MVVPLLIDVHSLAPAWRIHGVAALASSVLAAGGAGLALDLNDAIAALSSENAASLSGAILLVGAVIDVRQDIAAPIATRFAVARPPSGTMLELTLDSDGVHDSPSAPRADPAACAVIRHVLRTTDALQSRVSMRPTPGRWLERIDHAVRLAMRVNRPRVAISLDLTTFRPDDEQHAEAVLDLVAPRLGNVIFDPSDLGAKHRILDVVRGLRARGYAGPCTIATATSLDDPGALRGVIVEALRIMTAPR